MGIRASQNIITWNDLRFFQAKLVGLTSFMICHVRFQVIFKFLVITLYMKLQFMNGQKHWKVKLNYLINHILIILKYWCYFIFNIWGGVLRGCPYPVENIFFQCKCYFFNYKIYNKSHFCLKWLTLSRCLPL